MFLKESYLQSPTETNPSDAPSPATSPRRRRAPWTAALSLVCTVAAGCTTSGEQTSPAPSELSSTAQAPERGVHIYSDVTFTERVGTVAAYEIICAYRRDKEERSSMPPNGLAYKVKSYGQPAIEGFVDPENAGRVNTPMLAECPDPYPGTLPQPSPSVAPTTTGK